MSPTTWILISFVICILLMIVSISYWKVHPVTSILVASILLAIMIGTPWEKIEGTINKGMSDTLRSIAIVIVLGCIMGKILEETGAAVRITKSTVNLFGPKRVIWAIAAASGLLGIPIFADTVVILLIPIVSNLAVETKKSMVSYGTALYMGALVTASLIPPTPGPVAAAALLNLPLGDAILWGAVISIPSIIAATFYCTFLNEPLLPKDEYLKSAENIDNEKLPNIYVSLAPILVPLVLIFMNTLFSVLYPKTPISNFFKFIGSPLAALLIGCLFALLLTGREWASKKVQNTWVESALQSSAMPIMVTAMGGALAAFIKDAGIATVIAEGVAKANFPGIFIPIIIAALIHVVTGSNALGVMTAAALVEPMLPTLGISPLAAFLCCGTGALMFKHANSSGFWVTVSMSNMDIRQGIKGVGVASTVAGTTGAILTVILYFAGLI
ncbi:MAG: GntP family permease [Methylobacteriaceae bacterium]|jgi:GntP family gluconate:H+ symporter|nr:GntP family permease [Methylobacteriaceae bacterium]